MDAILNAIPYKLSAAYWAKVKADSFPASMRELLADLKAVEPKWRQETSLNKRLSGRNKGNQPGQGGNPSEGRIPRKDCGRTSNNSGGPQANASPNPKKQGGAKQKLCQRCAQWSPQYKNTHNTDQCRKWDKQGNPLDCMAKNIHAHKKENSDMLACMMQMQKDNAKMINALRKETRKSRRGKKRRKDLSDSSDSDSE